MVDDVEGEGGTEAEATADRAGLSGSAEGRAIASDFVAQFGTFVSERVRPVMRQVAADGGEPQQLMDGLADLLRSIADSIDSTAVDADRAPGPDRTEA
jgi:hypothetical protein